MEQRISARKLRMNSSRGSSRNQQLSTQRGGFNDKSLNSERRIVFVDPRNQNKPSEETLKI